jgi:hypothetical protein
MSKRTNCRACGAPIVLVLVIPGRLVKGTPRKFIPLDVKFHTAAGVRPSHAVSIGWTTCRPLAEDESLDHTEDPAMTHFATCPARAVPSTQPASTATEGPSS